MSKNSNKGFTLVELSIVLVIIGLLIGGILVAQSMITTAKVQATVRQLGQFDAAVANFYTKFNALPGDNNLMGAETTNTVDGKITDATGAIVTYNGEIGKFWYDLSVTGLKPTGGALSTFADISNNSTTSFSQTALTNTVIPQIPIGTQLGAIAFGTAAGTNYYMLSAYTVVTDVITATPGSALKEPDALAIDTKIDDGIATSGNVLSNTGAGLAAGGVAYNLTTTGSVNSVIRLGAQTGNLQ